MGGGFLMSLGFGMHQSEKQEIDRNNRNTARFRRKRFHARLAAHLCVKCGMREPEQPYVRCRPCLEYIRRHWRHLG